MTGDRPAFLPRVLAIALLVLGATATLTYAAGRRIQAVPRPAAAARQKPATIVVPDVRKEPYVFAKEQLADAGFAWRVEGTVRGYAANRVAGQSPAPGTRLLDTGAPLVELTLARSRKYPQLGEPQRGSPYAGTAVRLATKSSP